MKRRSRGLLGLLLVLAVVAASCGDDSGDADGDDEALTPITVGILPIADLAPFYYGLEQGFFEDEGLDVTTEISPGGEPSVTAVLNGEMQFALSEYVSLMLARQAGRDVQVVVNWVNGAGTPDHGKNGLLVSPDSGIEGVEDLEGKTFAVNLLDNLEEIVVRSVLDEHGVDDSDVRFVEEPFATMNGLLETGQVDAVSQTQPFVTLGEKEGLVNLLDPIYETAPSLPLGNVFASQSWLEENSETADAFYRAVLRSFEAASDEEAMRAAIVANTDTDADLVEELPLSDWDPEIDRDTLALLGELAVRYGILDEEPDLDELIWDND